MIVVYLKFAASQAEWIRFNVDTQSYRTMFLLGHFQGKFVTYIWPEGSPIMYDCEAKSWVIQSSKDACSERFLAAAKSMTNKDRVNVSQLVQDCLKNHLRYPGEDK